MPAAKPKRWDTLNIRIKSEVRGMALFDDLVRAHED
jgi:hypothetical protein